MRYHAEYYISLLRRVSQIRTPHFTGLGVIFYRGPMNLPVIPLGDAAQATQIVPVQGEDSVAKVLAEVSDASSPFHDGFHLVDVNSGELTHLAQFVVPPLPEEKLQGTKMWPTGARQMTALLVSQLESVTAVGLLSRGEASVYIDSKLVSTTSMF